LEEALAGLGVTARTRVVPNIVPIAIYAFVAASRSPSLLERSQGLIGGSNTPSLSGQDGSPDHNREGERY
jgi:hypothetical protein